MFLITAFDCFTNILFRFFLYFPKNKKHIFRQEHNQEWKHTRVRAFSEVVHVGMHTHTLKKKIKGLDRRQIVNQVNQQNI